jgi:catechol 2,3-dioxygenase-like lactoylglutathione lyase family enzyme
MIDHTAVNVTDLEAAKSFYAKALAPLGYSLFFEVGVFVGFNEPNGGALGVV